MSEASLTEVVPPADSPTPPVPAYDPLLSAFHRAFAAELQQCVAQLPLSAGARVLDVPCGDGFYTALLARRVDGGLIVGADSSSDYLERAAAVAAGGAGSTSLFTRADVYHLPFADDQFDAVFCAQSFISLEDQQTALREMRRVVRPGGLVAVLENDEHHHVLLPWPIDLEVTLQQGIRAGARQRFGRAGRLSPSRRLRRRLQEVGLVACRKRTFAADRQAPFTADTREFLMRHFAFLDGLVRDHLSRETRTTFRQLIDPDHPESLLSCPESELTCLGAIHWGRKP